MDNLLKVLLATPTNRLVITGQQLYIIEAERCVTIEAILEGR